MENYYKSSKKSMLIASIIVVFVLFIVFITQDKEKAEMTQILIKFVVGFKLFIVTYFYIRYFNIIYIRENSIIFKNFGRECICDLVSLCEIKQISSNRLIFGFTNGSKRIFLYNNNEELIIIINFIDKISILRKEKNPYTKDITIRLL